MPEQTTHTDPTRWRDRKRYLWLLGLIPPTAVLVMLPLVWALNHWGWHAAAQVPFWIGPILLYLVLPALDLKFGPDGQNPPDEVMEWLEKDKYYRRIVYAYLPFQYVTFILGAYLVTASNLSWLGFDGPLPWPAKIGLTLSVGMVGGVAINTAHELGHKKESVERWLSKIALAQTGYGHFYIEHNRGHHVRVATPEDPASARFGETFWEFLPRTVWGSLKSAWQLEAKRLQRQGKSPWHWSNDVLNAWAMSAVLFAVMVAVFGWGVIPYIVVSAVFGFCLLEAVNYLEHYGLLRQKTPSGRYERCAPEHSWNSDHLVTNLFLYHLQRHSDHHANPTRRYQTLRSMEGAPNLPSGYASMIMLTYVPALWRRVMDHRVLEHYNGDITRVNIHPRVRDKVLARYGAGSRDQVREEEAA
ncbi:fatty acid desaturase family protein [Mycolicibacterium hassiacum DSM 44199]|jgi:alkane 1-monooxygenase|uniref:Fatty acid desaturase family protein n=1 Tax=Mycolicibacterium hassiacum (strain DSM 44199 / CIP 105218 / JCM 12690 / 3849) TaxID=1122247 RepID=K5BKD8_MYCHD|nr:alkane 1-monooxygenase [Mycolicibacterium hassiacum]EKF24689.1 fatty acid desaturase family protein [Mycolicibacterium hassiacum DSM 44199]MBX5485534.1 alkane 1-monooxygenase [Mycolicibacterium hassiacum]MDA4086981.1 alkane 1-monooxygenase [Mycolicibacterium hassiacum DSM 44199]PZN24692.1 MAG: alkane 1-monooxygenase [Mycolicibacterium hassiacum]